MTGVNKAIIIGNLGSDPDVRSTYNGGLVANISVATSDTWKDKESGERQERTEWHRVVFFGKLADIVEEYLRKGSKVYVEGKIQTEKWTDQQGVDRYTTKIIANQMQMLDSRRQEDEPSPNPPRNPRDPPRTPRKKTSKAPPSGLGGEFDDDIPF